MVEPSEADVVGPAVPADDPDALANECSCKRSEPVRLGPLIRREPIEQLRHEPTLLGHTHFGVWVRGGERAREVGSELPDERASLELLRIE